jgi:hydroxypyruvate isomerase
MLRFSANLGFLWRELPLLERVRRAKASGFDAVELHFPYDVPAEGLRDCLAEVNLPVIGINAPPGDMAAGDFGLAAIPGREAEARASIDQALRYAEAIGAGAVHVLAGKPDAAIRAKARKTFLDALDYAAGRAEQAGITILMEPLNARDVPGYFLSTSEHAAEIAAELGRKNLKIMFDCYHVQIAEGDLTKRLERLLPVVGHVQIAAVPSRAEPDEGEIAYDRLLPTFEALGYSGYIGAEYTPRSTVEEGLAWLRAFRAA